MNFKDSIWSLSKPGFSNLNFEQSSGRQLALSLTHYPAHSFHFKPAPLKSLPPAQTSVQHPRKVTPSIKLFPSRSLSQAPPSSYPGSSFFKLTPAAFSNTFSPASSFQVPPSIFHHPETSIHSWLSLVSNFHLGPTLKFPPSFPR